MAHCVSATTNALIDRPNNGRRRDALCSSFGGCERGTPKDRLNKIRIERLLVPDVLPRGHQGVQTVLEGHDLESHVAGGQDENPDSVGTHRRSDG